MQRFVQRSQHSAALAAVAWRFALLLSVVASCMGALPVLSAQTLPDAPSALLLRPANLAAGAPTKRRMNRPAEYRGTNCRPARTGLQGRRLSGQYHSSATPCRKENPIQPIVSSSHVKRAHRHGQGRAGLPRHHRSLQPDYHRRYLGHYGRRAVALGLRPWIQRLRRAHRLQPHRRHHWRDAWPPLPSPALLTRTRATIACRVGPSAAAFCTPSHTPGSRSTTTAAPCPTMPSC